jgi:hypothetical protein
VKHADQVLASSKHRQGQVLQTPALLLSRGQVHRLSMHAAPPEHRTSLFRLALPLMLTSPACVQMLQPTLSMWL